MPEEPVKYKKLDKNAYVIEIEGSRIVAWKNPTDESRQVSGAIGMDGGSGSYRSRTKSEWEAVIQEKGKELMPLEEWKKKVASAVSNASGSIITPDNLILSRTVSEKQLKKCPNCNNPLFITYLDECFYCKKKFSL